MDRLWLLRPDLQVLYTSATGDSDELAAQRDTVRFLSKPFAPAVLLETVRTMLGRIDERA
jgi:hypothetical protein